MNAFKKMLVFLPFIGLAIFISCAKPEKADPCSMQYCLNGGECLNGDCDCPPGYTGEHCETKITKFDCVNGNCIEVGPNGEFTTKAECQTACAGPSTPSPRFDCVNGDCIEVGPNGEFTTKAECQAACAGPPTPSPKFDCVNGNCIEVGPNGEFTTKAECQAACSNPPPPPPPIQTVGNLVIRNNAPTPVSITINGETTTIDAGGGKEYKGVSGSKLKGTAKALVLRLSDQKTNQSVEDKITWNIDVNLPGGYSSHPLEYKLDVPSQYFFLRIKNTSNKNIDHVSVNSTSVPTQRTFNIPNDGKLYNIGYFEAKPNTTITTWPGTANNWIGLTWKNNVDFTLPFTKNQTVEMVRVN